LISRVSAESILVAGGDRENQPPSAMVDERRVPVHWCALLWVSPHGVEVEGQLNRFCAASVVDPAAFADATRYRRWREQFVAAPEDARVAVGERVERAHRREGFVLLDWPVRGAWPGLVIRVRPARGGVSGG
jgi:hypothetical protein